MKIICFGDSNTYGYDPRSFLGDRYPAEDRWVDILAKKLGCDAVNAGMNGRESPRYPVKFEPADLLLIMLGTNDLLQGTSAEEAARQMETLLTSLLPHYHLIYLISPPTMKRGSWVISDTLVEESIRLAEAYRKVAEKLQIPFLDTRSWNIELTFDGVHFTEEGHRTFAQNLQQALK